MNVYIAKPIRKGVWNVTERGLVTGLDVYIGWYYRQDFSTALLASETSVPKGEKGPYLIRVDDVDFLDE